MVHIHPSEEQKIAVTADLKMDASIKDLRRVDHQCEKTEDGWQTWS